MACSCWKAPSWNVHTYVLDPGTKAYSDTGTFYDRLKTSRPFDIDIDLTAVNRRRA
ncbi:hypothetical protein GCM10018785_13350 [Streptomyces longispororuber]|uniref:Uncharacterized protein n=1 Tax=Streptomyces longispororuber TaxID=68230 RepID=A0A918ZD36_9ACTN|nr:hypothetical protein [Streptomyces longispororuber]GHE45084.1 hypothetical protein GCM10018785_13350 [Streptomyces longispororuber]